VDALIAWLRRRLSPETYFGLQLTLGMLLFAVGAWLFAVVAEDVVTDDPLTLVDEWIAKWVHEHNVPEVTRMAMFVSWVHQWAGIAVLTMLLVAHLSWKRDWRWVCIALCTVPGGMLLNVLLKLAFHRARPALSELSATLRTYSFPSGHVMAATLLYALCVGFMTSRVAGWRWRVFVFAAAVFLVALVAFSRVYLGVHYLSDVLAAAGAGIAWFALCHVAVSTLWHRRQVHGKAPHE